LHIFIFPIINSMFQIISARSKAVIGFLFAALISGSLSAQQTLSPEQWNNAKQNGTINGKEKNAPVVNPAGGTPYLEYRVAPNVPVQPASTSCQCWQTRDTSWDIVPITIGSPPEYRNDDGSTAVINLPFNFCLYGTTWTQCYINNNGNVSFGAPYGTFTATGFPNTSFVMVAPFWSDVDTRNVASGLPHFKITNSYMIVQWDSVGYFSSHVDKVNTFQLIITDGSDPIVPGGNVSFCYKDMQWTTGDASSGVNGFGGSDAIVGANKGDGVNFIQFGAFNQPGGNYNGPNGPNSGIDWLDYQTFVFDACTNSNNVPPTVSGISICDTLLLCVGDTLPLNINFFSPEVGQNTVVTVDTTGTTGYVEVSNTSGNTASLVSYFVGSASNVGYSNITITATDNGTPPGVTTIPIVIEVANPPVTTCSADTNVCNGPVQLLATGGGTYAWSPATGLSCTSCDNPVASPTVTTTYVVSITNGCTVDHTVTIYAPPVVQISPPSQVCSGDTVHLIATGGGTYSWSPAGTLSNATIANPVATPTATTTYTVTVTDPNAPNCVQTASVTITVTPTPVAVASNDTTICSGSAANLVASGGTSYSWSPSGTLSNGSISNPVATPATSTTYTVTVSNGPCTDIETVTVNVQTAVATANNDTTICIGELAPLNGSGGVSYSWSPSTDLSNPNVANPVANPSSTTTYTLTVTDALGCTDTEPVTVTVSPLPSASFGFSPAVIFTDSSYAFTDLSTGGVSSWYWTFGDGGTSTLQDPTHYYATAGSFQVCLVTVSNNGCVDSTCLFVDVLPREVEVPNVFTPNGDGTNDMLVFKNLNYYPNSHLVIYDRWGVKVYESDNYQNDWNGKKMGNGGDCVEGTYYYILSGPELDKEYAGFITLLRNK
jgi:gliding motility-associated-like protein